MTTQKITVRINIRATNGHPAVAIIDSNIIIPIINLTSFLVITHLFCGLLHPKQVLDHCQLLQKILVLLHLQLFR